MREVALSLIGFAVGPAFITPAIVATGTLSAQMRGEK